MSRDRSVVLPAIAAAVALTWASLIIEPLAVGTTAPVPSIDAVTSPSVDRLARAVSSCDLGRAEDLLEEELTRSQFAAADSTYPSRDLILGIAAQSCGYFSASLKWIQAAPEGGAYGDWRLYALAQSAIALGQHPAANAALGRLRTEYSTSPLFAKALLAASSLAERRGDLEGAAEIAAQARPWQLESEGEALELAAWRAGNELKNRAIRRAAAIQLLTRYPLKASELEVVEEFRLPDGGLEWLQFLSPDHLVQRAESLHGAGLGEAASATLADVPEAARGWRWYLLSAELLTAARRGEEALAILDGMPVRDRLQEAEREWRQALAALEVSTPRSGRNLTAVQRQMMRDRAHEHLEASVARGLDPERTRKAFRILFEDALERDLFELALATMRRLKDLDPKDKSGAGCARRVILGEQYSIGWNFLQQRATRQGHIRGTRLDPH